MRLRCSLCPGHGWRQNLKTANLYHAASLNPRVSVDSLPNMEENNLKKSDALESKGITQEIRVVEIDVDEVLRYLKESRVPDLWNLWLWMEDLRRVGEILWYRDYEKRKNSNLEGL